MPDSFASFVPRLPWIVAAFAGLTVGGLHPVTMAADSPERAGEAGRTDGGGAGGATPTPLEALRWERRLIVAIGDAPGELAELKRLVDENACRLDERDTDVHRVTADAAVPSTPGAAPLDDASRDTLLALARAPFELVLIGKDGGVKRRAATAAALPAFLDAIDGMPMRRAERARNGGGC